MKKTIEDAYNEVKWCDVLRVFIVVLIIGEKGQFIFFINTLFGNVSCRKFFMEICGKHTRRIEHI